MDNEEQLEILKNSLEFLENSPPIEELYIKCCAMGEYYCGECGSSKNTVYDKNKIKHFENCKYFFLLKKLKIWISHLENGK